MIIKILIVYGLLNLSFIPAFCVFRDDYPESYADYTLLQILTTLFFFPAVLFVKGVSFLLSKALPYLRNKPFKKSRFKVGERVKYKGKLATILKNEKSMDGAFVEIRVDGDWFDTTVNTNTVQKLTALEKALK